ncbi:MAG: CpaF family protein [Candidatus Altiarchaeota archaeon]|nr:CpaF family protein [Candidatus Altiarchaeota archaeon]
MTVKERVKEAYELHADKIPFKVSIEDTGDYVLHYNILLPDISGTTRVVLDNVKTKLVEDIELETREILDSRLFADLKERFRKDAENGLGIELPNIKDETKQLLSSMIVNEMIGLGELELFLADDNLEEIVVNSAREPVWVYNKKYGWLKSSIVLPSEESIQNLSARVARQVSREITSAEPLLDAHLISGDRVNATLFPISTAGNTITIRRFSRIPWTIIHLMDPKIKTAQIDVAAFLWLAMEFELSMLVAGGTASGKTTMLNALMPFIPPNHRVISIEDTRELNLPSFLHWVPLSTRPPNPRGEGGVSMLDLMENSLRMRPDRVVVGEVRKKKEAEVIFEAMHTGHSVYGTFHAERAYQVVKRLTNPPMDIPKTVLESLHLVLVQYRNRRTGKRRTFEVAEIMMSEGQDPKINILYQWDAKTDSVKGVNKSARVIDEVSMHTGYTEGEIGDDLQDKVNILQWMLDKGIKDVESVGRVVSEYYRDKDKILKIVKEGGGYDKI